MPVRKATVFPGKPAREMTPSPDKPVGQIILVRASDPAESKPKRPKKSRPRPQPPEVDDLEPVVLPPEPVARPPRPVPPTSIHTLSLNDRRYSRMTLAVDGIGVRVKDTGAGGVADLDLFDGTKRIQKIRDLEVGRSQTFRGKSGTLYRVTLLGVHHKSRTVRLGVKRA